MCIRDRGQGAKRVEDGEKSYSRNALPNLLLLDQRHQTVTQSSKAGRREITLTKMQLEKNPHWMTLTQIQLVVTQRSRPRRGEIPLTKIMI